MAFLLTKIQYFYPGSTWTGEWLNPSSKSTRYPRVRGISPVLTFSPRSSYPVFTILQMGQPFRHRMTFRSLQSPSMNSVPHVTHWSISHSPTTTSSSLFRHWCLTLLNVHTPNRNHQSSNGLSGDLNRPEWCAITSVMWPFAVIELFFQIKYGISVQRWLIPIRTHRLVRPPEGASLQILWRQDFPIL